MRQIGHLRPTGRAIWSLIAFLTVFLFIISLLIWQFLLPALQALSSASDQERRQIGAYSALLLVVVLFVLFVLLIVAFRVRHYFVPRRVDRPTKTEYVDAWEEAGRRLKTPPSGDDATGEDDSGPSDREKR
jgi:uncharacterized BrkB/YihY/UPF0761 family membrane protein